VGCGLLPPLDVVEREYTQRDITVAVDPEFQPEYTDREYHIMLPYTYDPNKAYPLYLWGTGCGASHGNAEGIPMSSVEAAQSEVIFVFLMQEEGCFQAGSSGTANTPDVPYINKVLDDMEAAYCVDTNREFLAGWSSGAWLAATMSCALGNRLRGIAMSTGGQQPELMPCQGPIAALMFVGSGDGNNPIGGATGSGLVHERLVTANGCQQTTTPWNAQWPDCELHEGCGANPVVYCEHGGGHTPDNGTNITREGHYEFFMNLMGPSAD
jgi:poly(3-hydroxybutyrate) depolymerase